MLAITQTRADKLGVRKRFIELKYLQEKIIPYFISKHRYLRVRL